MPNRSHPVASPDAPTRDPGPPWAPGKLRLRPNRATVGTASSALRIGPRGDEQGRIHSHSQQVERPSATGSSAPASVSFQVPAASLLPDSSRSSASPPPAAAPRCPRQLPASTSFTRRLPPPGSCSTPTRGRTCRRTNNAPRAVAWKFQFWSDRSLPHFAESTTRLHHHQREFRRRVDGNSQRQQLRGNLRNRRGDSHSAHPPHNCFNRASPLPCAIQGNSPRWHHPANQVVTFGDNDYFRSLSKVGIINRPRQAGQAPPINGCQAPWRVFHLLAPCRDINARRLGEYTIYHFPRVSKI
jgi:hypothetical protein